MPPIPFRVLLGFAIATQAMSQVPGLVSPEPVGPFLNGAFPATLPSAGSPLTVREVFPDIDINLPMHVMPYPGTNRLLCIEKAGRVFTFEDDAAASGTEVFLDRRDQVFTNSDCGMTWLVFHPEFGQAGSPNRGYVYLTYKWAPPGGNGSESYWRLSRFRVPDGQRIADPESEFIYIQQYDRQWFHDSGCMMFGDDGYLYVGVGDEGGANDQYDNGQKLDDRLFCGILRIDVDNGPGSHPIRRQPQSFPGKPAGWPNSFTQGYSIPDDNPFVDPGGAYLEEFYVHGLRQPYRFARDPVTGRVWIGESGQDTEEELNLMQAGANYGWPFREGVVTGPKAPPSQIEGTLTEPVWSVNHAEGPDGCIVGGFVYRGSEHPQLVGRYIAVDNVSGRIRAYEYDAVSGTSSDEILTTMPSGSVYSGTSTIGMDHAGEPIFVKINGTGTPGRFYKLVAEDSTGTDPLWFRFDDRAGSNLSGYIGENPNARTLDRYAGEIALTAFDNGTFSTNARYGDATDRVPTGEATNPTGVRIGYADGNGYPGNGAGTLELSENYGRLDDFTVELSLRPETGGLAGGYQTFLGIDGITGEASNDVEPGTPIQPFRLMMWGRNDAIAVGEPMETGDLFLNVRISDPDTGEWRNMAMELIDRLAFNEGEWYHLAIVGDSSAGTLTVWRFIPGTGYQILAQRSGYFGNLQGGNWTLGRGMYAGNLTDYTADATFDELRIAPVAVAPSEFLYGSAVWPPVAVTRQPPALLSETGAFSDLATLTPALGVIPYTVNAPLWSDSANKKRWIALPNDGTHDTPAEKIGFDPEGSWSFPPGTVTIKHFELPINESDPSIVRRLETRFFIIPTSGEPYGLTYRWRPDGSDAELLPDGLDEEITITEASGGTRTQRWNYPSRANCMVCHNGNADYVLGLRTYQLNGDLLYPRTGRTANQLQTLGALGWFDNNFRPEHLPWFLKSHGLDETDIDPGTRFRSYLDSNCSQCHQPGGVRAFFDARFTTPLDAQGLIRGALETGSASPDDRVIVPGSLGHSMAHARMATLGPLSMPPLGKHLVDPTALAVLEEWILALPDAPTVKLAAVASAAGPFSLPLSFSEEVTGLDASDFEVFGGEATALSGSGRNWTVEIEPYGLDSVTVSLPANSAVNASGAGNFASAALTVEIVESGLATWLMLDEGEGVIAYDQGANANHAALTEMEAEDWIVGREAGALRFDSSAERLVISNLATRDFSVSFWMRSSQIFPQASMASAGARIFDSDVSGLTRDWVIAGARTASGVNRILFHIGNANGSPNTFAFGNAPVNTGEWIHVVTTRDQSSGEMKIFINGELDAEATGGSDSVEANPIVNIGGSPAGAGLSYQGDLDEIRIYDRVLTPSEIKQLHLGLESAPRFRDWVVERLPGLGHLHSPTTDIEGDGRSNFEEYAFGGDPLRVDALPQTIFKGRDGRLQMSYIRRRAPNAMEYKLFVGDDLLSWQPSDHRIRGIFSEPTSDPDYEWLTIDYEPEGSPDRLFMRIHAKER